MRPISYSRDIFRADCNPSFESAHCIVRLDQDIAAVPPYLNTEWGGFEYIKDPPSLVFTAAVLRRNLRRFGLWGRGPGIPSTRPGVSKH